MNHILGRSYLPPYLVDHLYKESQCQKLKSTLLHINELMSRGYSTEDKEHLKQLFTCSARPGTNYERIIRDAQEKAFLPNHTHSNLLSALVLTFHWSLPIRVLMNFICPMKTILLL